ncbi:MAG TPA: RNA methyltransferase [Bacilli bacterium]|nr:RNA methyltransferase [Bacilli bacterium]
MLITSLENNKIKDIIKLNSSKYRKENNKFIVEGYHLVEEAYKSGLLEEIFILEDKTIDINISTTYITIPIMKKITNLESIPDVIGICNIKDNKLMGNHILVLDGIQDPGNLGTIIRSAAAFNIDTIVLSEDTVDLYNSKVIRATQGMLFHINIVRENIKILIKELKEKDYKIYSTNVNNGTSLKDIKISDKYVIIIGNEGNGVSKEINDLSDENIYIKTNSNCESLNAAIATSIILYELSDN